MKKQIIESIQKTFLTLTLNSTGKSVPIFMHEEKVPDEVVQYKLEKLSLTKKQVTHNQ